MYQETPRRQGDIRRCGNFYVTDRGIRLGDRFADFPHQLEMGRQGILKTASSLLFCVTGGGTASDIRGIRGEAGACLLDDDRIGALSFQSCLRAFVARYRGEERLLNVFEVTPAPLVFIPSRCECSPPSAPIREGLAVRLIL